MHRRVQGQTGPRPRQSEAAVGATADVVVTGLRGSIQTSLNDKRQSDVQIGEINAQDIADFPDANLAESLQRLPGVSTAGSNDSGTSPNRSRSFDYNTFASELFSSLRVQKIPSAKTDEGSLGATIDLVTGQPFDYEGTRLALSSEASYNQNSKSASPRLAGLASFPLRRVQADGAAAVGCVQQDLQHHQSICAQCRAV